MQDPRALKVVRKSHPSLLVEGGFRFKLQVLKLCFCNCLEINLSLTLPPGRRLSQLHQGPDDVCTDPKTNRKGKLREDPKSPVHSCCPPTGHLHPPSYPSYFLSFWGTFPLTACLQSNLPLEVEIKRRTCSGAFFLLGSPAGTLPFPLTSLHFPLHQRLLQRSRSQVLGGMQAPSLTPGPGKSQTLAHSPGKPCAASATNCAALILPQCLQSLGLGGWYIFFSQMNTSAGKKAEQQTQKCSLPTFERSLRSIYQSYGVSM